jgi:hypothetical protein
MKARLPILLTLVSLWGCLFTVCCWVAAALHPGQVVRSFAVWKDGPVVHRAVAGYRWNGSGVVVQRSEELRWTGGPPDAEGRPVGPVATEDLLRARRAEGIWKLVPAEVRLPQGRAPAYGPDRRRSFPRADDVGAGGGVREDDRGHYLFVPFWLPALLLAAVPLVRPAHRAVAELRRDFIHATASFGPQSAHSRQTLAGRALNALVLASLLVCVAAGWLWVRSYRHEDRVSRCVRGTRYTVASSGGTLALYAPPALALNPQASRQVGATVAGIRNDQVYWVVSFYEGPGDSSAYFVHAACPLWETPAYESWRRRRTAPVAPLLAALEDPDRFAAAHALLWIDWTRDPAARFEFRTMPGRTLGRNTDEWYAQRGHAHEQSPWIEVDYDGLTVTLNGWADHERTGAIGKDTDSHGLVGDPDATQLSRVREQWHRRLDVAVWSVAWRHVFLVAVLVLGLQGVIGVRRRARRARAVRENLCLHCGYDLRATPGRCPECGTMPQASYATRPD